MRRALRVSWTENMAFALSAMATHKLRSVLTLLGVVAGVATVIMMVSFVVGFNAAVTSAFTSFGAQLVQFQKWAPRFGPDDPPEAERNRRAKIINAEGEQQAAQKLLEAAEIIARSPTAMQLRYLNALHDIASEKNSTIVFPMPMDLLHGLERLLDRPAR